MRPRIPGRLSLLPIDGLGLARLSVHTHFRSDRHGVAYQATLGSTDLTIDTAVDFREALLLVTDRVGALFLLLDAGTELGLVGMSDADLVAPDEAPNSPDTGWALETVDERDVGLWAGEVGSIDVVNSGSQMVAGREALLHPEQHRAAGPSWGHSR